MKTFCALLIVLTVWTSDAASYAHRRCGERKAIAAACIYSFNLEESAAVWTNAVATTWGLRDGLSNLRLPSSSPVYQTNGFIGFGIGFNNNEQDYAYIDGSENQGSTYVCMYLVWVKLHSMTGYGMYSSQVIQAKFDNTSTTDQGTGEYQLSLDTAAERFQFYIYDQTTGNSGIVANTFGAPALETWYLVAAYISSDGIATTTIGISVNGGTADTGSTSIVPGTTEPIDTTFGRVDYDLDFQQAYIDLDMPSKFNRPLTQRELRLVLNCGQGRKWPYN